MRVDLWYCWRGNNHSMETEIDETVEVEDIQRWNSNQEHEAMMWYVYRYILLGTSMSPLKVILSQLVFFPKVVIWLFSGKLHRIYIIYTKWCNWKEIRLVKYLKLIQEFYCGLSLFQMRNWDCWLQKNVSWWWLTQRWLATWSYMCLD